MRSLRSINPCFHGTSRSSRVVGALPTQQPRNGNLTFQTKARSSTVCRSLATSSRPVFLTLRYGLVVHRRCPVQNRV
ncbi:hypothetical protein B0H34DRAFT_263276 [Crassisporium funariophilum]|nr:hypothetical protein B0H34DRAFT_263276 [Crassisporium funariophilum]